jgi:hypothetical protein
MLRLPIRAATAATVPVARAPINGWLDMPLWGELDGAACPGVARAAGRAARSISWRLRRVVSRRSLPQAEPQPPALSRCR